MMTAMFIITSNNKTLQSLRDILIYNRSDTDDSAIKHLSAELY